MSKIWFISDQHHNHKNICGPSLSNWSGGYRNFSSLKDMTDTIIDNINSVVAPDDTIYDLGDFAMGNRKLIPSLRERIRCRNYHLICGNHDGVLRKRYADCFSTVQDYLELRYKGILLCLMHYPLAVWNENGHGSINLHGHSHGSYKPRGRQLDVGVDVHQFCPISIDEVMDCMLSIDPVILDHHTEGTSYK